jgi:hypothetical protein
MIGGLVSRLLVLSLVRASNGTLAPPTPPHKQKGNQRSKAGVQIKLHGTPNIPLVEIIFDRVILHFAEAKCRAYRHRWRKIERHENAGATCRGNPAREYISDGTIKRLQRDLIEKILEEYCRENRYHPGRSQTVEVCRGNTQGQPCPCIYIRR